MITKTETYFEKLIKQTDSFRKTKLMYVRTTYWFLFVPVYISNHILNFD